MEFQQFLVNNQAQLIATGVAVVGFMLFKYIVKKLIKKYGKLTRKSEGRMAQVKQMTSILINFTFILTTAVIWGIKTQNLVIGLTTIVTFFGVGMFAQWSILSNVTAGIIMFFSAPYRLGDKIRIIDKEAPIVATIEYIKAFYTHLRTEGGELIVLPNNIFLQKMVSIISDGTINLKSDLSPE